MTSDVVMMEEDVVPFNASTDASHKQVQQFCLLAKTAHGAAILELIKQVLEAPGVYVFAELLAMPNIEDLKNGIHAKYYNTLDLFAYGTYKTYRSNPANYLELTPAMQKKLHHLTIVSLAIKMKCIPYEVMLEELEIDNVRHLEDIIIEAIYADIIHGKLFQNNRFLEIDYAQGRDIPPGYTATISDTLQDWVEACEMISNCIDQQIDRANSNKATRLKNAERIENELANLRKVLKTQHTDSEEPMQVDSLEYPSNQVKKTCRTKTARPTGSTKFVK